MLSFCGLPQLQVTYQTATGQTLDLITKPGNNFENFTLERYITQVSFFSYCKLVVTYIISIKCLLPVILHLSVSPGVRGGLAQWNLTFLSRGIVVHLECLPFSMFPSVFSIPSQGDHYRC